jgi:N6-L-threonylcarbamoyladenine synthase
VRVLALETSCDDTCAAVIDGEGRIHSNVISSQEVHDRFGGVVPEIASRRHLEIVNLVVASALERAGTTLNEIDLMAATRGPGLVGALLVGFVTGKALAAARELPFAAVDHLQGHVAANFIAGGDGPFEPPFVCLIASGGHTLLAHVREHEGFEVLGSTLDDAAGEAFDKGARMLGLGYPGGVALEALAKEGDPTAFPFSAGGPRPGLGVGRQAFAHSLDFSFAGLKTALLYKVRELSEISRPPTRRRSSRAWWNGPSGRWSRPASSASRSAGGSPPTASCAGASASWARTCTCPSGCCAPTTPR